MSHPSIASCWVLVLVGAVAPACGSGKCEDNSQACYSYPGCAPTDERVCPRSGTFSCAAHAIEARHASCSASSDCVITTDIHSNGCTSAFACTGAVVNVNEKEAFLRELQVEIDRYCAHPVCTSMAACAAGTHNLICESGRCIDDFQASYPPDAAVRAGLADAATARDAPGQDGGDAGPD